MKLDPTNRDHLKAYADEKRRLAPEPGTRIAHEERLGRETREGV